MVVKLANGYNLFHHDHFSLEGVAIFLSSLSVQPIYSFQLFNCMIIAIFSKLVTRHFKFGAPLCVCLTHLHKELDLKRRCSSTNGKSATPCHAHFFPLRSTLKLVGLKSMMVESCEGGKGGGRERERELKTKNKGGGAKEGEKSMREGVHIMIVYTRKCE